MKLLESSRVEKLAALFLLAASVLVGIQAIDSLRDLFEARPALGNTITVEGVGSAVALPDIATVRFTVREESETSAPAQDAVAQKVNATLEALREDFDIEEKDIKTTSYNVSPRYSRPQPCFGGVCPEFEQEIIAFTVSQSLEIKVRDIDSTGGVLSILGDKGVYNVSGPSFAIDDPDALKEEARGEAIKIAQDKAKRLSKDLGVSLGRVVNFWENSNDRPFFAESVGGEVFGAKTQSIELPKGENEINVTVSITYEIR